MRKLPCSGVILPIFVRLVLSIPMGTATIMQRAASTAVGARPSPYTVVRSVGKLLRSSVVLTLSSDWHIYNPLLCYPPVHYCWGECCHNKNINNNNNNNNNDHNSNSNSNTDTDNNNGNDNDNNSNNNNNNNNYNNNNNTTASTSRDDRVREVSWC